MDFNSLVPAMREVALALYDHKRPYKLRKLADALGIAPGTARTRLNAMERAGIVEELSPNTWRLTRRGLEMTEEGTKLPEDENELWPNVWGECDEVVEPEVEVTTEYVELTPEQSGVLRVVASDERVSEGIVAGTLGITRTSALCLLMQLVGKGLLEYSNKYGDYHDYWLAEGVELNATIPEELTEELPDPEEEVEEEVEEPKNPSIKWLENFPPDMTEVEEEGEDAQELRLAAYGKLTKRVDRETYAAIIDRVYSFNVSGLRRRLPRERRHLGDNQLRNRLNRLVDLGLLERTGKTAMSTRYRHTIN